MQRDKKAQWGLGSKTDDNSVKSLSVNPLQSQLKRRAVGDATTLRSDRKSFSFGRSAYQHYTTKPSDAIAHLLGKSIALVGFCHSESVWHQSEASHCELQSDSHRVIKQTIEGRMFSGVAQ